MTTQQFNRRVAAVKTADAINAIEGAPVSDYARMLSLSWARSIRSMRLKIVFWTTSQSSIRFLL